MKGIRLAIFGIVLLALAAGCSRIPLHEQGSGVYLHLTVDRSQDPLMEAYLDAHPSLREKFVGKMPEMVRACFYDAVSHDLVSEDFLPPTGGFVSIRDGIYDVVIYSMGTEATQVSGSAKRAGAYAFTDPTGVRVRPQSAHAMGDEIDNPITSAEQPVVFEPDHLFVGKIAGAVVPVRPDDADPVILSAVLTSISESWSIEIPYIEGAERIRTAEVFVTGLADGRFLWDGRTTGRPCAIGLKSEIDAQGGRIDAVFNSFGRYPQPGSDVLVMVLVTTNSGARCLFSYNAADQWLNPDNSAHRLIFDETMEIPGDDYKGSGVDPVVIGWEGEEITVIIAC